MRVSHNKLAALICSSSYEELKNDYHSYISRHHLYTVGVVSNLYDPALTEGFLQYMGSFDKFQDCQKEATDLRTQCGRSACQFNQLARDDTRHSACLDVLKSAHDEPWEIQCETAFTRVIWSFPSSEAGKYHASTALAELRKYGGLAIPYQTLVLDQPCNNRDLDVPFLIAKFAEEPELRDNAHCLCRMSIVSIAQFLACVNLYDFPFLAWLSTAPSDTSSWRWLLGPG